MTVKEIKKIIKDLDRDKYELFAGKHIAFDFNVIFPDGELQHVGMASAPQLTILTLSALCDLFSASHSESIEAFAESVKCQLIRYYYEQYNNKGEIITINPDAINPEEE